MDRFRYALAISKSEQAHPDALPMLVPPARSFETTAFHIPGYVVLKSLVDSGAELGTSINLEIIARSHAASESEENLPVVRI